MFAYKTSQRHARRCLLRSTIPHSGVYVAIFTIASTSVRVYTRMPRSQRITRAISPPNRVFRSGSGPDASFSFKDRSVPTALRPLVATLRGFRFLSIAIWIFLFAFSLRVAYFLLLYRAGNTLHIVLSTVGVDSVDMELPPILTRRFPEYLFAMRSTSDGNYPRYTPASVGIVGH